MVSQTTSTEGETTRVTSYVNQQGDTMVSMHYEDARLFLKDVLYYEFTDSLLTEYKMRDTLNTGKITLQKSLIDNLNKEKLNLETMVENLEAIIVNKDEALGLKDKTIKEQKKEIRKQKFQKILGFAGTVILPIVVILVMI